MIFVSQKLIGNILWIILANIYQTEINRQHISKDHEIVKPILLQCSLHHMFYGNNI